MKRRISFISEHASPLATLGGIDAGGQNIYVGKLAIHLARLGYEIDIFTRWDDERLPNVVEWHKGVRVVHIKAGPITFIPKEQLLQYMDEFYDNMVAFMKQDFITYQLIHANFWMSAYVAAKMKKSFHIPFIITFHALGKVRNIYQGENDKFPKERTLLEEEAIAEAVHLIAECPQDREDLIKLYNTDPEKITVIPAGFDPHEFYPIDKLLSKMVLDIHTKEPVILQLGRMVERKGIDTVIKGLSILRRKYNTKARLLIVGGDSDVPNARLTPEIGRLRKIAKKEGVKDFVSFVGRRSREALKYYYNAADVFVSTPWYEPFGITPVEAMACGTPVIGSNVGGIKYTVQDSKTGYLIPAKDPEALARKMGDILTNRKLVNLFRENAIKRVNTVFSWDIIASQVSKLYESFLYKSTDIFNKMAQVNIIDNSFQTLTQTIEQSQAALRIPIMDASQAIIRSLLNGGKILVCGNGGSAADAQHFAAELVGRYMIPDRKALPVISLNTDTAVMTAWSNDYSYDSVFSRQVSALGQKDDTLIGISTSGNSRNINYAFLEAHKIGMTCVGLLGKDGGDAINVTDIAITVPSENVQRIQELHTNIIHTICDLVEKQLFAEEIIADRNISVSMEQFGQVNIPYLQKFGKAVKKGRKHEKS